MQTILQTLQQEAREKLRRWWSFSDNQNHTHSWHTREDFIEKELPMLIASAFQAGKDAAVGYIESHQKSDGNLPIGESWKEVLQEARNAE